MSIRALAGPTRRPGGAAPRLADPSLVAAQDSRPDGPADPHRTRATAPPGSSPRWPAVPERARPLLSLLFDDLAAGERINLRALRDGRAWNRFARDPAEALEVARELVEQPGTHVLLGVLPRRGDDGTARGLGRGTCLWVDIDARGGTDDATLSWRRLARCPIQPSAVVHSGRGLHAYWRLGTSVPLDRPAERDRFGEALRRLAHALGGDPAATDLARVLRLPGSLNWKYDPARPVSILASCPRRRPSLDQIFEALPPAPPRSRGIQAMRPPTERGEDGRDHPPGARPVSPGGEDRWVSHLLLHGAAAGQRNAACARLTGYFLSRGLPPDVARAIVLGFAARCRPSLQPAEAERVVRSIARYRPRGQPAPDPNR